MCCQGLSKGKEPFNNLNYQLRVQKSGEGRQRQAARRQDGRRHPQPRGYLVPRDLCDKHAKELYNVRGSRRGTARGLQTSDAPVFMSRRSPYSELRWSSSQRRRITLRCQLRRDSAVERRAQRDIKTARLELCSPQFRRRLLLIANHQHEAQPCRTHRCRCFCGCRP